MLTRHSLTWYRVLFGSSLISWNCKKQYTMSKSSAETEYKSMADTCCEVTWLLAVFEDFGIDCLTLVKLYCDNQSVLYIASNSVFHEHTNNIKIDCHLVRKKLNLGIITTSHIASASQSADIFTKALSSAQLHSLCSKLNVCNLFQPFSLRGDVTAITNIDIKESVKSTMSQPCAELERIS